MYLYKYFQELSTDPDSKYLDSRPSNQDKLKRKLKPFDDYMLKTKNAGNLSQILHPPSFLNSVAENLELLKIERPNGATHINKGRAPRGRGLSCMSDELSPTSSRGRGRTILLHSIPMTK